MSSRSSEESLRNAVQQVYIYVGFFILITSLSGNLLNIIVFTSLKTFRETSCAFYLTVASVVNIFQCLAGLFSRILSMGYSIDLTKTSSILCKARLSVLVTVALISLTSMCFAAADQYTSLTIRWRHLSNRQAAFRLMAVASFVWCLHGISVVVFTDVYSSPLALRPICGITNGPYTTYYSYFIIPILFGFLPITVRIIFGLMAFINVRSLTRREVPIVRLRRDKQLTAMVSDAMNLRSRTDRHSRF
jgi:hypothetical protein